jgi:hypothetical protein
VLLDDAVHVKEGAIVREQVQLHKFLPERNYWAELLTRWAARLMMVHR